MCKKRKKITARIGVFLMSTVAHFFGSSHDGYCNSGYNKLEVMCLLHEWGIPYDISSDSTVTPKIARKHIQETFTKPLAQTCVLFFSGQDNAKGDWHFVGSLIEAFFSGEYDSGYVSWDELVSLWEMSCASHACQDRTLLVVAGSDHSIEWARAASAHPTIHVQSGSGPDDFNDPEVLMRIGDRFEDKCRPCAFYRWWVGTTKLMNLHRPERVAALRQRDVWFSHWHETDAEIACSDHGPFLIQGGDGAPRYLFFGPETVVQEEGGE